MNYFITADLKLPFHSREQRFCVLLNPPGALYIYTSEDDFYNGKKPLKTYQMYYSAISAINYDYRTRQHYLVMQNSNKRIQFFQDEEVLQQFRHKLLKFCNINYNNVLVQVTQTTGVDIDDCGQTVTVEKPDV